MQTCRKIIGAGIVILLIVPAIGIIGCGIGDESNEWTEIYCPSCGTFLSDARCEGDFVVGRCPGCGKSWSGTIEDCTVYFD